MNKNNRPTRKWTMCSSTEAEDRAAFKELSPFECTPSSYRNHPRDRIPDPFKCVKKYRRSAAGGGVVTYKNETSRSIEDIELTVCYLLGQVYASQQSCDEMDRTSLVKAVNFVDDRLRAVQVDLTTLMGGSAFASELSSSKEWRAAVKNNPWNTVRNIQARLIRYNLLSQYMLSDLDSKAYEWKFAHTALTTAVSSYFATFQADHGVMSNDCGELDEVMSYAAFLHIATVLKKRENAVPQTSSNGQRCGIALDDGEGMSAILGLYRRYAKERITQDEPPAPAIETHIGGNGHQGHCLYSSYPKYQYALRIASAVETGNYLSLLRLLRPKDDIHRELTMDMDEDTRWRIMMRCCLVQVLPLIRIGLIRQYNKSFGKQEKVKDSDIADLLHLPTSEAAIALCQNIGLPTLSSMENGKQDRVVMKAAPISVNGKASISKITNPGRSEDEFVFGCQQWLHCSSQDTESPKTDPFEGMTSLQRAMMAMKVDDDPNEIDLEVDENLQGRNCLDEDGVIVFPTQILHALVS